jgi:hypothetical protein
MGLPKSCGASGRNAGRLLWATEVVAMGVAIKGILDFLSVLNLLVKFPSDSCENPRAQGSCRKGEGHCVADSFGYRKQNPVCKVSRSEMGFSHCTKRPIEVEMRHVSEVNRYVRREYRKGWEV